MDTDFQTHYRTMHEAELMTLARGYDSLTDPAQTALRAEFVRRGLEPPLLDATGTDEEMVEARLVTVARYRDLSEAIVARSMLESAGIGVLLRDENLVRLDWQVSNFIGGIRLQVSSDDEASTRELLTQPVEDFAQTPGGAEFIQPRCPNCGSAEITFEGASRAAALPSLFVLSVPVPPGRETWACSNCGARWEDTDRK